VTTFAGSRSWGGVRLRSRHGTESPFAPLRCYLAEGRVHRDLDRHYSILIAPMGSCARPSSSPRPWLSRRRGVFAGCRESLLGNGPSRRYLHNPCIGAWIPTPERPSGASARFYPEDLGLVQAGTNSARSMLPAMQLLQGGQFRGCNHFVMFRLLCSLGPPVAPTAAATICRAAGPLTPRRSQAVAHSDLWYRYMSESGK
jgi:hypothetical protein